MPHQTPNPHDAEETLRPALSSLYEAEEAYLDSEGVDELIEYRDAALAVAYQALVLLGVHR